jgi:hypothetical protein
MNRIRITTKEVFNTTLRLAVLSGKPVDDKIKNLKTRVEKQKAA